VTWKELPEIESAGRWTIADVKPLLRRAASKALRNWGVADQSLPRLA